MKKRSLWIIVIGVALLFLICTGKLLSEEGKEKKTVNGWEYSVKDSYGSYKKGVCGATFPLNVDPKKPQGKIVSFEISVEKKGATHLIQVVRYPDHNLIQLAHTWIPYPIEEASSDILERLEERNRARDRDPAPELVEETCRSVLKTLPSDARRWFGGVWDIDEDKVANLPKEEKKGSK